MGASSSTANPSPEAHEQREQETLASAALALPLLRAAFTRTSSSTADANALPDALAPPRGVSFLRPPGSPPPPPHFHDLLTGLGPAVASLFSAGGAAAGADGELGPVPQGVQPLLRARLGLPLARAAPPRVRRRLRRSGTPLRLAVPAGRRGRRRGGEGPWGARAG
ncbi:unnamed protein product [Urochloa humidicola]